MIKSHVISYWENKLRGEAAPLLSLSYFHPSFMSLVKPHPIWTTVGSNPFEVTKAIQQARFLSGRYRSESLASHWSTNTNGYCLAPTCNTTVETIEHILTECASYRETMRNLCNLWLSVSNPHVLILVLDALCNGIFHAILARLLSSASCHTSNSETWLKHFGETLLPY